MLIRNVLKVLALFFFGFSFLFLIPLAVAAYYEFLSPEKYLEPSSCLAFLLSFASSIAFSGVLWAFGKNGTTALYRREAILVVTLIWFLASLIASLPYIYSSTLSSPLQAYFEAASGLTTTGASVFQAKQYDQETGKEIPIRMVEKSRYGEKYKFYGTITPIRNPNTGAIVKEGVEAVSKGVLFWRSFTQWLGGCGIVVLLVAVLPALGIGARQLVYAEMPGPIKESLTPRIKETASKFLKIYFGLTVLEIIFLLFANQKLSLYEAFTITFSTVSTGGFAVTNESIGAYHSKEMEWVILLFMFLSSINFSLYFFLLIGKVYRLLDQELLVFFFIALIGGFLVSQFLLDTPNFLLNGAIHGVFQYENALRTGLFQFLSAQTTTGFATANFDLWPYPAQALMLFAMFLGGMAGSTSGGIKVIRHIMLFRICQYKVESVFRPETFRVLRVGGKTVNQETAIQVFSFFVIVIAASALGTFFLIVDGVDMETAFSVISCMINNVGIAFRAAGPRESFAFLDSFGLVLCSFLMVLGRLECLAVLAVLVPAFWSER